MKTVDVQDADFPALVAEAEAGEEIILEKAGKPVARITQFQQGTFDRQPGRLRHLIKMKENFDDPLPPGIAEPFGMDT